MKTIIRATVGLAIVIAVGLGALSQFLGVAHAQIITVSHSGPDHVYNTPDGSGDTLASPIVITMQTETGLPIVGYPLGGISLTTLDGSIVFCPGGAIAERDTDATGTTTISGPFAGGGFSVGPVYVTVDGIPLTEYPLSIFFNSSDSNGDLVTNLADFSTFGVDFAGTAFRSDFTGDGRVDLADFAKFGLAYFTTCP